MISLWVLLFGLFGMLTSGEETRDEEMACAEIWDLFPNSTDQSEPNREGYFVAINHPYFDTVKGYVPGEKYNVKITSHDLRGFYEYTVVVFSAKFPGEFLGRLHDLNKDGKEISCGNETAPPALVVSRSQDSSDVNYAIDLEWTAPSSVDYGCALFVVQLTRRHSTLVYTETSFCANHGSYKHYKGAYGEIQFVHGGPADCWILVEVPFSHQVNIQVKKMEVVGDDLQCSDTSLGVSTNETEASFSEAVTFCPLGPGDGLGRIIQGVREFMFLRLLIGDHTEATIRLSYYGLSKEKGCNVTVSNEESGVITSPNYPDEYFPGLDCFIRILGKEDERLEFQFLHLDINDGKSEDEASSSSTSQFCPYDFLKITNGIEPSERALWCGFLRNDTLGKIGPRQTVSSVLGLHFHSDEEWGGTGFLIYWTAIGSCRDSVHAGAEGSIASVNYPRNYLNDQRCLYTIRVPDGYIVELQFSVFHLEPLNHFAKGLHTN